MGQGKLHLAIWPIFSITEAYEIVCIKYDSSGTPFVYASVGPYLTKDEASVDLQHICEENLNKREKKSYPVDF